MVAITLNLARGPYTAIAAVLSPDVAARTTVSPGAEAKTFRIPR
jgi:hypothetical protein